MLDTIIVLPVKNGCLQIPQETEFHTIELDGILYSREIFYFFGADADAGDLFRFARRENRGIWLDRLDELREFIRTMAHCPEHLLGRDGKLRHDKKCTTCRLFELAGFPIADPDAKALPA